MPAFLTNNQQNQCCCPEMRCCTPNTVSATVSGHSGTLMSKWVERTSYEITGITDFVPETDIGMHACAYEAGATGCFTYYDVECTVQYDENGNPIPSTYECHVANGAIWPSCQGIVWPSVCFPQQNALTDQPGLFSFKCGSGGQINGYISGWEPDAACAAKCADDSTCTGACNVQKLCQKPGGGSGDVVYGPGANADWPGGRVYLPDYNGTYVCHRYRSDKRPEMVANINRTMGILDTDIDARLVFDVFCRRRWQFIPDCEGYAIPGLNCQFVSDPPPADNPTEGEFYCIDYRCGPRVPGPQSGDPGAFLCDQYKCTAHEGTVWPHVLAFDDAGNNTADLKVLLAPDVYFKNTEYYYQGAKPQKAMTWKVSGVEVRDGGSGYEVGEFFTVDFDPFWMELLQDNGTGGGELNIGFPENDWECFGYPLTWKDKYGLEPEEVAGGGKIYRQRLRVSEVDGDGAITALEIVPWFRTPEFYPGQCITEVPNNRKTPYYPAYTRAICHPNSVDIGGTGYDVEAAITFIPISPGVEENVPAIAKVVDVDDDGAVLDWEIKGSDTYYYGFGLGNPACEIWGQPDERGAYHWHEKYSLCDLWWHGIGVPVRSVSPAFDGLSGLETFANTGHLTELTVSIARVPCRTAISVWLVPYKYTTLSFELNSEGEDAPIQMVTLKKFPPYPKCFGGGAQITPVIGTPGGNESAIGGPLVGGEVKSGGDYYTFVDKTHVQPVLPKDVPVIGQGVGAKILGFSFASVTNFPYPGYAEGESHVPSPSRFAYFIVTGATIDPSNRGTGYTSGDEFEVKPVDGVPFTHPWRASGGDDPSVTPNGAWYPSQPVTASGHVPSTPEEQSAATQREGTCTLRVASVNEQGGITGLEVVHGGMMFKTELASGVRHPDIMVLVNSDTGQGARAAVTIDTNKNSATFGEVTGCSIVPIPVSEATDPLHPAGPGENPVPWPLGGRDYANPPSGLMWEMQNISTASGLQMNSHIGWHGFIHNPYHPDKSTHDLIEGGHIPFHRRAEHCSLEECYHSLLNRSYPLYRVWTCAQLNNGDTHSLLEYKRGCIRPIGPAGVNPFPNSQWFLRGQPKVPYGLYRTKGKINDIYASGPSGVECTADNFDLWNQVIANQPGYNGPPSAYDGDWAVIEYGYSVSLSATTPVYPNCPDHEDGRTGY